METRTKSCGPIPGGLILTHTQIHLPLQVDPAPRKAQAAPFIVNAMRPSRDGSHRFPQGNMGQRTTRSPATKHLTLGQCSQSTWEAVEASARPENAILFSSHTHTHTHANHHRNTLLGVIWDVIFSGWNILQRGWQILYICTYIQVLST